MRHPGVIVVGARAARQGTGPFIAAAFNRCGARVSAVIGTRSDTVNEARESLATDHNIECRGYTELPEALALEQPDIVAICSPYPFHAEHLAQAAQSGCHVLVEKPLAWPTQERSIAELIQGFSEQGLLLQMVSQWPQTLGAFSQLHGPVPECISDFSMGLSPISIGPGMVPDSAPHFIGMLQALLGPGDCQNVRISLAESSDKLTLECLYQHAAGATQAGLYLATCEQRPRPAWYQINQLRVDREVELPQYNQALVAGGKSAALSDPIEAVVGNFLIDLGKNAATDAENLLQGYRNLVQLASAWPQKV
jgi:hypothetical protein